MDRETIRPPIRVIRVQVLRSAAVTELLVVEWDDAVYSVPVRVRQ